ncbi:MAG: ABC transporter substrate-binding protein [Planctomycetes bacterium]|nr:ABC transporter substrate-binding protein [Planctomycetota bacterium]
MSERWAEALVDRDASGEVVEIAQPATRVVSLVPSITETLFALDKGQTLVARTRYCIHPAPEVRSIKHAGGTKDPDLDAIVAIKPDIVFANKEENLAEHIKILRDAGITVHVSEPKTPDDALRLVALIGSAIDEIETAAAVVLKGEQVLAELRQANEERLQARLLRMKQTPAPRALAMIWQDPWMAAAGDTYIGGMIRELGAENPLESRSRYPELSDTEIMALQPNLVLLPSEPYPFQEAHRHAFCEHFPSLPAVKEGRVFLCSGEDLMWFGARTPAALKRLRRFFA